MEKYIGIKHHDKNGSNIGLIWEKQSNGNYKCINWSDERELTQEQINHDLNLNYLKPLYDKNISS